MLEPSRHQVGTNQAPSRHHAGTKLTLTRTQRNILKICNKPRPMAELLRAAERSDRTKFKKGVVDPLLNSNLLEMTEPNSPNSPTQKYRITEKGLESAKAHE